MTDIRIPTEIVQLFTPEEAWEYNLLPYGKEGAVLCCYGNAERDYAPQETELEVVFGFPVRVAPLPAEELHRLLHRYYRKEVGIEAGRSVRSMNVDSPDYIRGLIEEGYRNNASDIHFEPYEHRCRVRFRIDGGLIERYVVEKGSYAALVNRLKIMANLDISEKRLPQDGRILYRVGDRPFDLRVSSLPTIYGEKVVLRLLTRRLELLELGNLGFDGKQLEDYTRAIRRPNGLVLISGPTGSGKSTTLYATLRLLNKERSNILTIEDPVEYTLEGINQVQLKEEIGLTFGSALRTFLRQDPDIIMLGEIRDADTAQMAVRSSLTGHLLLSTIHTNSAWGSVARMTDMGIHPYLLADTLVLCVAQRLVRILCPHCKQPAERDTHLEALLGAGHNEGAYYRAVGCERCYYTGYSGRKAVYEVIPVDHYLAEQIRRSGNEVDARLKQQGIRTLKDSMISLYRSGDTSLEELAPLLGGENS